MITHIVILWIINGFLYLRKVCAHKNVLKTVKDNIVRKPEAWSALHVYIIIIFSADKADEAERMVSVLGKRTS